MTIKTTWIRRPAWIFGFLALSVVIALPGKGQAQSPSLGDGLTSAIRAIAAHQKTQSDTAGKKSKSGQEGTSPAGVGSDPMQDVQSKSGKGSSGGQEHIESVSLNYIPKADNVGNFINTVAPIFETAGGNVGIGTTNPQAKAHIYGTSGDVGLRIESGPGATRLDLYSTTGGTNDRNWTFRPDWFVWRDLVLFRSTSNGGDPVGGDVMFYIKDNGNVGIGAFSAAFGPATELHLARNTGLTLSNGDPAATGAARITPINSGGLTDTGLAFYTQYSTSSEKMRITSTGNVGIGTPNPAANLHVVGSTNLWGNVSIGTTSSNANLDVQGSVTVSGNIAAKYQDVAEWVPARRVIPPGSVVVLDAEQSNHVLPSSRAYDTRVAGVVSARPGVILGEGGAGKVMVATTGRVRVKVDATGGPIRVGDLLVTSDKEGIAMRSQPLDLGGTPIHRPGTLIGKALEPLEKGVGEILVLLSLQ